MNNTLQKVRDGLEILASHDLSATHMKCIADQLRAALDAAASDHIEDKLKMVSYEMDQVAITHAHGLALDLGCILADDYHGKWYDSASSRLASYREAMNAIHERESPTFLGEPVIHNGPSSLAQQVKNAQMKIAAWSPEKRASVKLEGGLK